MRKQKCRQWLYRYACFVVLIIVLSFIVIGYYFGSIDRIMEDQPTFVTIGTTFAGFLFTGQGIILTLSPTNRFLVIAKKHGYIEDFHRFCRYAEISFLSATVFSLKIFQSTVFDLIFLLLFLYALIFAIWALVLFGQIVHYYNKSVQ